MSGWVRALHVAGRVTSFGFYSAAALMIGLVAETAWLDCRDGVPPHSEDFSPERKQKLVIVGSGWGAVGVIKNLKPGRYDVTCVSDQNYFLFTVTQTTPLLPSVSVGTLHAASLVEPMRNICQRINATFIQARVDDVDTEKKTITILNAENQAAQVPYDILVLAVGARSITWGVPGVKENCCFLKSISDARKIRNTILQLFEEASLPHYTDEEREKMLKFVIVGGGPSGVEFAAELNDFICEDLKDSFACAKFAKISLIQSADHILNTYDAAISKYAEQRFKLNKIDVILNAWVTSVEKGRLNYSDKTTKEKVNVDFGMCVWTTGIGPQPFIEKIVNKIPEQNHSRAVVTDNRLRMKGAPEVFALGDCATIQLPRLLNDAVQFFERADVNNDGILTMDEFEELSKLIVKKHPILATHLSSTKKLFSQHDYNRDGVLSLNELKELLKYVDNQLKCLPATAQAASQEGHYLADLLNHTYASTTTQRRKLSVVDSSDHSKSLVVVTTETNDFQHAVDQFRPFKYKHAGSLAYVGADRAVVDFGQGLWGGGLAAMVLWKSAYLSEQVSANTRLAIAIEWIQRPLLGRNIAKY